MLSRRTTFAFLLAILIVAPAGAQVIGKIMSAASLPVCNSDSNFGFVSDATNSSTLGSGGGSALVLVRCISGTWTIDEFATVADLSTYLPISATTAAPVVIQVSGAGNDASLIASDDVFLTPADALTAVAGGAVTLTSTAGTMALASSAGAITVTAVGATNDVTLTAADDVIVAATDAVTLGGASATINAAGSTVELTVAAGSVRAGVALGIPSAASLPTCDSTIAPAGTTALYWDTTGPDLCACPEGVDWVTIDGSGTCA